MADHQKVYPVDVEAPSSTPLMPSGSLKSDKGDPHPPFKTQTEAAARKRSCFCKFMCWTISLILLLVILIAAIAGILYLAFQPKLPKYSIDRLQITNFSLNQDDSLSTQFSVNITIQNPNKNIGVYYEDGSEFSVYYTDIRLCEGSLPQFYQGHRNTTVLDVMLTGQTQNATSLITSLVQQQRETGSVPLKLKASVPVRVKLGKLKLKKVKFIVRCNLVVDRLFFTNFISIRSNSCKFKLSL